MTLKQFKNASGMNHKFEGYSWTCIYNCITQNAKLGLEAGDITKSQEQSLLNWRDRILDSRKF